MNDYYTENLVGFGLREIEQLRDILSAWLDKGLPAVFEQTGVKPAFNLNSGYVFLVYGDYQVAMLNGPNLEIFHTLPYSGTEGFLADLLEENTPGELDSDDAEYLLHAAHLQGCCLPETWQTLADGVQVTGC